MKGVIAIALKEMISDKFGVDKWNEALVKAGVDKEPMILPISDIDDQLILKIINSACNVLDISLIQAADAFGDYWVNVYSQKIYSNFYRDCKTAKDFLLKMNSVHVTTTKNLRNARPPKFEYEWKDEKTLIMKYESPRNLIDFMVGLIKGVGRFYNEDLKVVKLGDDKVEITFP